MTATVRRRGAAVTVLALGALLPLAAGLLVSPAGADTPEGWAPEPTIGFWQYLIIFGALPLLAFVVITVLVYAPSLARGEPLRPGPQVMEDQWLGGPRKAAGELAAPDDDESKAGGASGRW